MSSEIKTVRIKKCLKGNQKRPKIHAFVEFNNKTAAKKNFKLFREVRIGGQKILVNYMGQKNTYERNKKGKGLELNG